MLGEMVEWSKAPHWKCGVGKLTEGSNPSLSAIFFCKKWRTKTQVFSSRGDSRSSLKRRSLFFTSSQKQRSLACEVVSFR